MAACSKCGNPVPERLRPGGVPRVCETCQAARRKERQRKHYIENRAAYAANDSAWKKAHPENAMVFRARRRAKKYGVPCTVTASDIHIPDQCPILGIPLVAGAAHADCHAPTDNSPSLDRIIPARGYVPGNVAVISHLANRIKDAGTAEEHRLIADWMDAHR